MVERGNNQMKIITFLLILLNSAAFAEKGNLSVETCINKTNGSTLQILGCIDVEIKKQDKRLNTAYQNLMKSLTNKRKEELKKTQQLWIKYRDANCDFYRDPDGGTMASIFGANCIMDMTTQRAKELEDFSNLAKEAG
jgi:uncharacterized protein YecT (DUF1311 family)